MKRKTKKESPEVKNHRKKKKQDETAKNYSFVPFVLLAVSVLVESCLLFPNGTGAVGGAVQKVMCGLLGAVVYLVPVGTLMLAFCFFEIRRRRVFPLKITTLVLFVLFFAVSQSVIGDPSLQTAQNISEYYNNGALGVGGGAVGGLLGKLMVLAFDKAFAGVISILLGAVSLSFFIGASPLGVWSVAYSKFSRRKKLTAAVTEPKPAEKASPVTLPERFEPSNVSTTVSDSSPITKENTLADPFIYGDSFNVEPQSEIVLTSSTPDTDSSDSSVKKRLTVVTNENPMTAAANIPVDKNGVPRAYSPFAQPFFNETEMSAQQKPASYTQTDKNAGRAYSPFADPIASMNNDSRTDRSLPPQAYIACDASYPNISLTGSENDFGNFSNGGTQSSETQVIPPQSSESQSEQAKKRNGLFKFIRHPSDLSSDNDGQAQDIYTEEPRVRNISNIQNPHSSPNTQTPPRTAKITPEPASTGFSYSGRPSQKTIDPDFYSPPFEMDEIPEDDGDDYELFDSDSQTNDSPVRQVYGNVPRYPNYTYPQFDILDPIKPLNQITEAEVMEIRNTILEKLASFRIDAELSGYSVGPTITRYEITPGSGVKVRQITALTDDLALALQSDGVRIATVSGKSVIGVEVPNEKVSVVSLRALLESREFINAKSLITVCVGLTVTGKPVYMDIDDMPHVLIAGETKSGKSVAINCMILSLLYRASPDDVQLILIDPKRVELNIYSKIPHLVMPVIDDPKRAAAALRWAVNEMDRRYMLLDKMGVRNRAEYCELRAQDPSLECMPQIIIVIDELADLMLQVREYVEELINRLAAMARACGIHLLVGTQRPSVDIITGLIKANIPARIAFKVSSAQDSRIILGGIGAEKLLGRGDMLYQATGAGRVRIQGAFVSGSEIKRVTKYIIDNNGPAEFDPEILRSLDAEVDKMNKSSKKALYTDDNDENSGAVDGYEPDFDLLCRAIEYILETGKTSTNNIQRVLHVGFNRAADIVDTLEDMGFLSRREGNRPRDVQVSWEMYEEWKMRKQM